jgi:hypothetical protein
MSNLSFLLNTFVGLLAIWAGSVLLCLALFPPLQNRFKVERMSSMRAQTIPPPYEPRKIASAMISPDGNSYPNTSPLPLAWRIESAFGSDSHRDFMNPMLARGWPVGRA